MMFVAVMVAAAVSQVPACLVRKTWEVTIARSGLQNIANIVRFERNHLTWNHVPIDAATLQKYLAATSKLVPQPRLIVDVEPMDCLTLDRIMAAVDRAGVDCRYGKCIATDVVDPPAPPPPPRRN
jgi:hypothetical protein